MKNNRALIVELKNNENKKLCGIFHRLKKDLFAITELQREF